MVGGMALIAFPTQLTGRLADTRRPTYPPPSNALSAASATWCG